MNEEPKYQVIKPNFKYGGKVYQKGDSWVPAGLSFDDLLIEQGRFVMPVKDRALERAKKVRYAQSAYNKPPALGDKADEALKAAGYDTPEKIAAASDKELLAIEGIGKARLKKIREATDG